MLFGKLVRFSHLAKLNQVSFLRTPIDGSMIFKLIQLANSKFSIFEKFGILVRFFDPCKFKIFNFPRLGDKRKFGLVIELS